MPITHQISSNPLSSMVPGGDVLGKLSGMIGQAQAMLSAGNSLPGIQAIGGQIAGLASTITSAGTSAGVSTSNIAGAVGSLGASLAGVTSMSGVSGLLSSLTSQLGSLTSLLNPSGALSSAIHSHVLEAGSGITHSAFSGQHVVNLASAGINLLSSAKISNIAPMLPHNGFTTMDIASVAQTLVAGGIGITSDRRLKSNINEHPSVLEDVLKLRLKTFDIKSVNWEYSTIIDEPGRPTFGLIAQEVQEIFPQVVDTSAEYLTLEESKIGLLLLGAFQEFVKETRAEIASLKAELKR